MTENDRLRYLPAVLRLVGVICIFGVYPLTVFWPSGWVWHNNIDRSEYLEMIIAIYATLGVFLLIAARNPKHHVSLISYAIWSSIVHGAVMAIQALANPAHIHHLYGDVLVLFAVAALLGYLAPWALRVKVS